MIDLTEEGSGPGAGRGRQGLLAGLLPPLCGSVAHLHAGPRDLLGLCSALSDCARGPGVEATPKPTVAAAAKPWLNIAALGVVGGALLNSSFSSLLQALGEEAAAAAAKAVPAPESPEADTPQPPLPAPMEVCIIIAHKDTAGLAGGEQFMTQAVPGPSSRTAGSPPPRM